MLCFIKQIKSIGVLFHGAMRIPIPSQHSVQVSSGFRFLFSVLNAKETFGYHHEAIFAANLQCYNILHIFHVFLRAVGRSIIW